MINIKKIFWERSNIHFILSKNTKEDLYISNNKKTYKLERKDENEFYLNITNTELGTMLEAGEWSLNLNNEPLPITKELIDDLENLSRNFKYRDNLYAYLVNFKINSELELIITTDFMMKNYKPKSFYRLSETKKLKTKIKIIVVSTITLFANMLYKLARLIPINKNKVLFLTENNNELKWNLKAMYEYLKEQDKYKIDTYSKDKYKNKTSIIGYMLEIIKISRTNIIFVDNYTPILTHLKLSKKVKLIQLWHAGIGFKSVGYARFGLEGSPHPYKSCHRNYTHAIVDQKDLAPIYQEVFGVKKEIFISTGIPRLDGYLTKERIDKACDELYKINPKFKTKKVILFSPTYRGTGSHTAYYDFELLDIKSIVELCKKNNSIFVIKNHPFINKTMDIPKEYSEYIYDYSSLDINDLIYISDIMITDYSSCAYEYSLFDRTLIFYRFDKELYEYERPMHTVNKFTSKQYETKEFDEVIKYVDKISKEIKIEDRFKNIKKNNRDNTCKAIEDEILGD